MTTQIWVDETRDMLLSGYVEELDLVVTAPIPATTGTELVVQGIASSIVKGVIIEVNTELMYVTSVTSTTISVMRGYGGSTAATHIAGDLVRVSPKFPAHRIISSLNDDLADICSPANGMFQIRVSTFTYNGGVAGYNLDTDDGSGGAYTVDSVYEVTHAAVGVLANEPEIISWRLKRDRDTGSFASGNALILYDGAIPGRTVRVLYKSPLTPISTTDLTLDRSLTGLATSAYDLPPLGAAMALMTTRPIRREFLDAQGTSRMGEEVPPGAISASFRDLMGRRRARLEAETSRLVTQYPQQWSRHSAVGNSMWGYGR
jgi:hypothetical protein|tara:strand:+ start:84 stop:1034 length:951 start_codon:yes stop_codon:yes gene_type:complete